MSTGGVNNNNAFLQQYLQFKNDNDGLTAPEMSKLIETQTEQLHRGNFDAAAIEQITDEVMADGVVDADEKRMLMTVGFASDAQTHQAIQSHVSEPSNQVISDLIQKGFNKRDEAAETYRQENPNKSAVRDKLGEISNAVTAAASSVLQFTSFGQALGGSSDNIKENLRVNTTEEAAVATDSEFTTRFFANDREFRLAAESKDCLSQSLSHILGREVQLEPGIVSEDLISRAMQQAGIENPQVDSIRTSEYRDNPAALRQLLQGQEGDAMVVAGTHAYVLQGVDTQGNLQVLDTSQRDANGEFLQRTISKNNPAVTVYVGNQGDQDTSDVGQTYTSKNGKEFRETVPGERHVNTYQQLENVPQARAINSTDNASSESFNIRKLFALMGDQNERGALQQITSFINNHDVQGLKDMLASRNINLDSQEVTAFITRMTEPVQGENGNSTTMLEMINSLNGPGTDDSATKSMNRTYYQVGIQYSDVDLTDYFTRTSAEDMMKVFQDMIEGKTGC